MQTTPIITTTTVTIPARNRDETPHDINRSAEKAFAERGMQILKRVKELQGVNPDGINFTDIAYVGDYEPPSDGFVTIGKDTLAKEGPIKDVMSWEVLDIDPRMGGERIMEKIRQIKIRCRENDLEITIEGERVPGVGNGEVWLNSYGTSLYTMNPLTGLPHTMGLPHKTPSHEAMDKILSALEQELGLQEIENPPMREHHLDQAVRAICDGIVTESRKDIQKMGKT